MEVDTASFAGRHRTLKRCMDDMAGMRERLQCTFITMCCSWYVSRSALFKCVRNHHVARYSIGIFCTLNSMLSRIHLHSGCQYASLNSARQSELDRANVHHDCESRSRWQEAIIKCARNSQPKAPSTQGPHPKSQTLQSISKPLIVK